MKKYILTIFAFLFIVFNLNAQLTPVEINGAGVIQNTNSKISFVTPNATNSIGSNFSGNGGGLTNLSLTGVVTNSIVAALYIQAASILSSSNTFASPWSSTGTGSSESYFQIPGGSCTIVYLQSCVNYVTSPALGTNSYIAILRTNGAFAAGVTNTGPTTNGTPHVAIQPCNVAITNGTLIDWNVYNTSGSNITSSYYSAIAFGK
jgi:hypothetical protein